VEFALDIKRLPYLNLDIGLASVQPYLDFLQTRLDNDTYLAYTAMQQHRDKNRHHVTVVTPLEFPDLAPGATQAFLGYPVRISLLGVGHLAESDNEVYFIVCASPEIEAIRCHLGLAPADLHITLGFRRSDIFDRRKNASTLLFPYSVVERPECQRDVPGAVPA
jgi:hypothetical protein